MEPLKEFGLVEKMTAVGKTHEPKLANSNKKNAMNMSLAWLESMQAVLLPKKRNRGFSQLCVTVALTATQALH